MSQKRKRPRVDDALRSMIESSGKTVYRIAKDSGTTTDSIYRFLKGQRDLRLKTAADIAAVLGLELSAVKK